MRLNLYNLHQALKYWQQLARRRTITTNTDATMSPSDHKTTARPLGITDVVLRDAHQSLLATRFRTEDMLPIAGKLDQVGYWSLESWGGATFDACIRYLGEDPWERIRAFKKAMPNTPQQMLLRGQNLLGYRHYADDVVRCFVERAALNGVDVFRVFDAMNDPRNLRTAIKAVVDVDKHAQGTISYTTSPVHKIENWLEMGKQLEDMGVHSIAIKDMAGLLTPYTAYELVSGLKKSLSVPIHMQSHATTGMSTCTILKAVEAGIDNVDTAISSMSMTTGHSATETVVAIMRETKRDTKLNIDLLAEIADYFRGVRKRYAQFEGSLRGVDTRILQAQVPGGMLTNMENQLREQNATERMSEVFAEIPKVREDLGYLPLVTPTSQIVGTQAVMNVLAGKRYANISRETAGVLKGEYGKTPAPVNKTLQKRVLTQDNAKVITCRPADTLKPEMDSLEAKVRQQAKKDGTRLAKHVMDDVLTYALFPKVGWDFLCNRDNPEKFETPPPALDVSDPSSKQSVQTSPATASATYQVNVEGHSFAVTVHDADAAVSVAPTQTTPTLPTASAPTANASAAQPMVAPMAGNIFKLLAKQGDRVAVGDVVLVLEAMKMETEVRASHAGVVNDILVAEGDKVSVGDTLLHIA